MKIQGVHFFRVTVHFAHMKKDFLTGASEGGMFIILYKSVINRFMVIPSGFWHDICQFTGRMGLKKSLPFLFSSKAVVERYNGFLFLGGGGGNPRSGCLLLLS